MDFQALAKTFTIRVTLMCISMCWALAASGQGYTYTAEDKFITLVTGGVFTDTVYSYGPTFYSSNNNFQDPFDEMEVSVRAISKDYYELVFSFENSTFKGTKSPFEVQSFSFSPSIHKLIRYNFTIVESIVVAKDDFVKIENGTQAITLDPLANDEFNDVFTKNLIVTDSKYGSASVENQYVTYQVSQDFQNDVLLYTVSNFSGVNDQGAIYIYADKQISADEINYEVVSVNGSILIFLPNATASNTLMPKFGSIKKINNQVYEYKPGVADVTDKVIFYSGGYNIVYNIEVKSVVKDKGLVKDDVVFTPTNTQTTFNVFLNDDTKANGIINYSDELTYLGNGAFSYLPESNFVGLKKFFYETGNKLSREVGEISVNVGNIDPSDAYVYKFDVVSGMSHTFTYEVPFDTYSIAINSNPLHGAASAYRQNEEILLDCGSIQGKAVVSYFPMPGYTGTDEMTIKYCAGNNDCKIYKLRYTVSSPIEGACDCGTDCVWPGDVNRDGVVSPSDLLLIGKNYGHLGIARSTTSLEWHGQSGPSWGEANENARNADTNGDGIVDRKDVSAIVNNLGKLSALVPSAYGNDRTFPFYLIPQSTEVDSGDLVVFDVFVGSDDLPLLDAYGLSFNIRFAPGFLDSSSVEVNFVDDSWFATQSPIIDFAAQKENGLVTAAISRTHNKGISGKGLIGQVVAVVKDEVEGFKEDDVEFIMQNVIASGIILEDSKGNKINAEPVIVPIKVNRKTKEKISINDQLVLYPNPTAGDFNLSLTGQDEMKEISIIDMAGNLVRNYKGLSTKQFAIVQEGLPDGMYIVRIQTSSNTLVKKLNVVNAF